MKIQNAGIYKFIHVSNSSDTPISLLSNQTQDIQPLIYLLYVLIYKIYIYIYILYMFFKQAHILKSPPIGETFISAVFQVPLWGLKKGKQTLMYVSMKTVYKVEDCTWHELPDTFIT